MTTTYKDLAVDTRKEFKKDTGDELNYLTRLAEEAFIRKSRLLTVTNAGGVVSIISYLGAVKPDLNYLILITLSSFFIGLLLNGFVIFKAEKRYVKSKNDYFEIRHKYMNFESTMTLNDFENELKDSYQSALKDASCENVLEA